ncbi:MAG: hypothetical protein Q9167_007813 [Letrouitia subvulpina]
MTVTKDDQPKKTMSAEFIADLDMYRTVKPYYVSCVVQHMPEDQRSNIHTVWKHGIPIHDVRGIEQKLSFEEEGFKIFQHDTRLGMDLSEAETQHEIEELALLLAEDVGAEKAICYDMRTYLPDKIILPAVDSVGSQGTCHRASEALIYLVTTCAGFSSMAGFLSTISQGLVYPNPADLQPSLWKPLVDVVEDNPLAICDPRSVARQDLVEVDRVTEAWAGEIYYPKYRASQHWWWLSRQRRNEISAFLSFDSREGNQFRFCPHVSFQDRSAREGATPRRSVEIRIITFNRVEAGKGALYTAGSLDN